MELAFGGPRINYGANRVRFAAPVPAGSQIHASVTFTDITDSLAGTTVTAKYVLDAGADKPACVAETLVLITN